MEVDYFAETTGFSGVRVYSRKLMEALDGKVELNHVEPYRVLKPGFVNKPLLNPYRFPRLGSDVVHVTNQDDLAAFPLVLRSPLVVTVHDIFPYVDDYSGPVYSTAARLYVWNIEKHADRVIANSEFVKQQLLDHTDVSGERIEVVYQGVDTDTFRPVDADTGYGDYYLHVGSEIGRKNIPGLVSIFSRLKQEKPGAKLVRVGSPSPETLEDIEEEGLELGEDVIYEQDVSTERLVKLYSNAFGLLFPSHGEGFGRPMLESLACGTPVVAYDRKPMSEVLPDEMLVEPGNEHGFAEKALGLKAGRDRCRSIAREYTWKKTADAVLEVYRDAAE